MNPNKRNERLGNTNLNYQGVQMTIVEYTTNKNIVVEFTSGYRKKTTHQKFMKGCIKDVLHPEICGIGYVGEGDFITKTGGQHHKSYKVWRDMIERCYDPYAINKHPTYANVFVCDEWHNFQNFARWFDENYYRVEGEEMQLDKDLLVNNNKCYSPNSCAFVPRRVNNIFKTDYTRKHNLLTGAYHSETEGKYKSRCHNADGKMIYLGTFDSQEEAHHAFLEQKRKNIIRLIALYKDKLPEYIHSALVKSIERYRGENE